MAGVGTLTFYDPDTGAYGALGHGITDTDTAQLMPLSSGSIMETSVKAVKKGEKGEPGQLKGTSRPSTTWAPCPPTPPAAFFGTVAEGGLRLSGTAPAGGPAQPGDHRPCHHPLHRPGDDTGPIRWEIVRLCPMNRDGRDRC